MLLRNLIFIYLLGGGFSIALGISIWRDNDFVGQTELIVTLIGLGSWMVFAGFEILSVNESFMKIAATAKMWLAPLCAFAWTLLAAKYADVRITKYASNQFFLSVTWLLIVFNDITARLLGGYWDSNYPIITIDGFSYVPIFVSPMWLAGLGVTNTIAAIGAYWIVRESLQRKSTGRKGMVLLALGLLLTVVLTVLTVSEITQPSGLDFIPLGAFIFVLGMAYVFLREQSQYMQPIKRDDIYESLSSATIVLDEKQRLVDYNDAAYTLLPWVKDNHRTPVGQFEPFKSHSLTALADRNKPLKINSSPDRYVDIDVCPVFENDEFVGNSVVLTNKTLETIIQQNTFNTKEHEYKWVSIEELISELRPTLPTSIASLSVFEDRTIKCNPIAFQEILRQIVSTAPSEEPDSINLTIGVGEDYISIQDNNQHSKNIEEKLELLADTNGWDLEISNTIDGGTDYIFHNVSYQG